MAESRYSNRLLRINDIGRYRNLLKGRGVKSIMQYTSPKFITLPDSIREIIETRIVVWQTGDKYFKLADEHYGNPNLWWIIASYNMAPTEAHLDIGDIVYVPINWDVIYDTVRG